MLGYVKNDSMGTAEGPHQKKRKKKKMKKMKKKKQGEGQAGHCAGPGSEDAPPACAPLPIGC